MEGYWVRSLGGTLERMMGEVPGDTTSRGTEVEMGIGRRKGSEACGAGEGPRD